MKTSPTTTPKTTSEEWEAWFAPIDYSRLHQAAYDLGRRHRMRVEWITLRIIMGDTPSTAKALEQFKRLVDQLQTVDWTSFHRVRDMYGWFLNWYQRSEEARQICEGPTDEPSQTQEQDCQTAVSPLTEARPSEDQASGSGSGAS